MKKVAVLGLAVLLLTGCAKTVKCTTKDKDAKIKYSVKGTFKKENLQKYTYTITYDTKDDAKKACENAKKSAKNNDNMKAKCSGKKVKVTVSRPKDTKSEVTKDEFIKGYESAGMTCK